MFGRLSVAERRRPRDQCRDGRGLGASCQRRGMTGALDFDHRLRLVRRRVKAASFADGDPIVGDPVNDHHRCSHLADQGLGIGLAAQ